MKGVKTRNSGTIGLVSPNTLKKIKNNDQLNLDAEDDEVSVESKFETSSGSSSSSHFHMGVEMSPSIDSEEMEILKKVRHNFSKLMDFNDLAKEIKYQGLNDTCRLYVIGTARRVFLKEPNEDWSKNSKLNKFAVILENGNVSSLTSYL